MKKSIVVVLSLLVCTLQSGEAQGPPPNVPRPSQAVRAPAQATDVVLVGFHPWASAASRAAARASANAVAAQQLSPLTPDSEKLRLPPGRSVADAIKALSLNPAVRYAEPDYAVQKLAASNDALYMDGSLWGMYGDQTLSPANPNQFGSQADEAWAAGRTGSSSVYVGVIDEGIDWSHEDLAANIWASHGWDFFNDDSSVYDGAGGDAHGTHVAGTIGGKGGNSVGVAGVNWDVTLISAKFLGPTGGYTSDAIDALDYLTGLKTRAVDPLNIVATNNSWGGGGFSQALLDAINRGGDAGILFVVAAGNSSSDNDAFPSYPSSYQCTNGGTRGWDCIVSVASITSAGAMSSFSSYGATSVDLGAPGSDIWSTLPGNSYGSYSGTSMATPHVTGAVALCAAFNPSLSPVELRNAVVSSAAPTASLAGKTATGGRLDIGTMIASWCPPPAQSLPGGAPSSLAVISQTTSSIRLQWTDGVIAETSFQIQRASGNCSGNPTFTTVGWAAADMDNGDTETYLDSGLASSTDYCYRVRGTNSMGPSEWSSWLAAATLDPPPPYVVASGAEQYSWIDATDGVKLSLGDDASVTVSLPFPFPFYEVATNSVTVSSNGFLRLTPGLAMYYNNTAVPLASDPNGIVAPFWDDLNPAAANPSGGVWTLTEGTAPNRKFVVAWVNVPHYNVPGSDVSVEVVLEEATGDIVFQYQDVDIGSVVLDNGASATIGIEDALGDSGTLFSYNEASVNGGAAYRFTPLVGPPPPPPPPPVLPPPPPGAFGKSSPANNARKQSLTPTLGWTASANVDSYEYCYDTTNNGVCNGTWTPAPGTSASVQQQLSRNTTYYWQVRARNPGGTTEANGGTWWKFSTGR